MSGTPLDRIRRQVGVAGRPSSYASTPATGGGDLTAILAASRGGPADLREIRAPAVIGFGLALATIFGHGRALDWSVRMSWDNDLFVYRWLVNVLTVWNSHTWTPALAGVAAVGLLCGGIWTRGLRTGQLPAIVVIGVALVCAGVAVLPLAIAVLLALVALVVAVALFVAVVVLGVLLLFALLASMFE